MVGGNTLLGETLRVKLPELARDHGHWKLARVAGSFPAADPQDPLSHEDNPMADACDGILARDGGHFEAQFASGAEAFADAATELLHRELPGLRFRISIDGVERQKGRAHLSSELPVLAPCQWSGRGLQSTVIQQGNEQAAVSLDVARRHAAAKRAEKNQAKDLASLLSGKTKLKDLRRPQDLDELVGNRYLAVIHADGNGVGRGAGKTDEERARFFHRNRVLLRRAVQKAIDHVCEGETGMAPLVLLMLGGDDLLVLCRAEKALPFVVKLCEELAGIQNEAPPNDALTLGVGVVIAKHKVPMHRLHEVAEQLASSAKRRFRGLMEQGQTPRSVVDWAVYTTAWVDAPEAMRRRHWICGAGPNRRVLSQRPLDVLGEGLNSLQGLLAAANQLAGAPRSQLRYLVEQLPRGKALAELAFEELPKQAEEKLKDVGISAVWQPIPGNAGWTTPLLDLVEIFEIANLGRSDKGPQRNKEVAHA
jgi:hypothetical protein